MGGGGHLGRVESLDSANKKNRNKGQTRDTPVSLDLNPFFDFVPCLMLGSGGAE